MAKGAPMESHELAGGRSRRPASDGRDQQRLANHAAAAAVGELFQYTAPTVTLARQRSAMIPILNDPFNVTKVSVFNQSVLDKHPLNGARLKNDSPARFICSPAR